MAKITLKTSTQFQVSMERLGEVADGICKMAIYEGAAIMTDQIKKNLDALPTDKYRYLRGGDKFTGVPEPQKQDLKNALGISPMKQDENGDWNTKIGFDGYGSTETNKYPGGVPNPLLARSIESGSSVRAKTPFVRPAINQARTRAKKAMADKAEEEMKKIIK